MTSPDPTGNVLFRPAGQQAKIVKNRLPVNQPADWQNLQHLDQIPLCQTRNKAVYTKNVRMVFVNVN